MTNKKKSKKIKIEPLYIKNKAGKTTHVYLDIEAYDVIMKARKEFDEIKKKTGIRWVRISGGKKTVAKKKK